MSGALAVRGVGVRFGGDVVLHDVDLDVTAGSLHGLIGPNGAGKTTLVNAITGFVPLDGGTITFDGRPLERDGRTVARMGIARVFQSPSLATELSAVENVMIAGHQRSRSGFIASLLDTPRAQREGRRLRTEAEECLRNVGFTARPDVDVRELAFGALRQVEIARALMLRPRMILFDEPTAGMTGVEVARVGELLRGLVGDPEHPIAMLLIEHNVPFVFDLCDEITALHQGRVLTSGKPEDVRAHEALVSAYLGSAVADAPADAVNAGAVEGATLGPAPGSSGAPALRLSGVTAGYGKADVLREVDLEVTRGELTAIFGANGAGKTTMFHAIMGLLSRVRGEITAGERRLRGMAPNRIVRAGIGFVPQDPHLLYGLTVEDNLRLAAGGLPGGRAELSRRMEAVFELFESLGRLRGAYAAQLSGGERRMLGIGKALVRAPEVLILDEPSIGLAPATVDAMATAIRDLNRGGLTVVVAEQNARWLLPIATRKYVLERGSLHELHADDGDAATEIDLVERYLGVALTPASRSDIEQIER